MFSPELSSGRIKSFGSTSCRSASTAPSSTSSSSVKVVFLLFLSAKTVDTNEELLFRIWSVFLCDSFDNHGIEIYLYIYIYTQLPLGTLYHTSWQRCKQRSNVDQPSGIPPSTLGGASHSDHAWHQLHAVIRARGRSDGVLAAVQLPNPSFVLLAFSFDRVNACPDWKTYEKLESSHSKNVED